MHGTLAPFQHSAPQVAKISVFLHRSRTTKPLYLSLSFSLSLSLSLPLSPSLSPSISLRSLITPPCLLTYPHKHERVRRLSRRSLAHASCIRMTDSLAYVGAALAGLQGKI